MDSEEKIICAAIWYDDGIERPLLPRNIKSGVVVGGWRHPNCKIVLMSWLYPNWQTSTLHEQLKNEVNNKEVQGFLTSHGRFVNRVDAAQIWVAAGNKLKYSSTKLYSEDIY